MIRFLWVPLVLLLFSCASWDDYYRLDSGDRMRRRQIETKRFETEDEAALLSASAQVLQDLGFTIEESETGLGLITASKDREVISTSEKMGIVLLSFLGGTDPRYDVSQRIYGTLQCSRNSGTDYSVRVNFTRIVKDNLGELRMEEIKDRKTYGEFFSRLGQSLFLTANDI